MKFIPKHEDSPEPTPTCRRCGSEGSLLEVRGDNLNGNARRPYYRCSSCGQFLAFCDERGLRPTNPQCGCGEPSRRQMNGQQHRVPRGVHYVCSQGRCGFYDIERNTDGSQLQIWTGLVDTFIEKGYI
jgi:hypothetical protein